MDSVDACLPDMLRTLEVSALTFSIHLVLADAGTRPSPVQLQADIYLSGEPVLQEWRSLRSTTLALLV